ncbi:hypothetical protein PIB30_010028 [Stylosanthes scabra]|uniref:Uncharacterized protein n=1 Tax=Stylosanthes scabra TaxID=79078 RepID=A0ABU6V4U1_9FABA|nr:hypothetical protein [Stylosanthes scabra]
MSNSNLQIQTEQPPPPAHTPLLTSHSNQNPKPLPPQIQSINKNNNDDDHAVDNDETHFDRTLARLELLLTLLGFNQRTVFSFAVSWTVFALVGTAMPLVALALSECSDGRRHCEKYEVPSFEMAIVAFQACLAAVSLLCLSHNLRKYGVRRFLFVDRHSGQLHCFHRDYVNQISGSLRLLVIWMLPCFFVKTAREIIRISNVQHESWVLSVAIFFALIISWTYVTGYGGMLTFLNGGDFAVSTLVQVVGIIICLHAATRISHRAQGVVSLASRWHALMTCSSDASQLRSSASTGSLETVNQYPLNSIHLDYSESDLESMDYAGMPTNTQLASYMSSHHKRQAFVMYLQTNPGGITIFGWTVDRSLVNTIFFLELSLVTFVLSKTII